MQEQDTARSWYGGAAVIPVLTGAGAIALYVIGLVNMVGSLRDGGLSTEDVLPLLPVERHLATGIGALANPTAVFIFVMSALSIAAVAHEDSQEKEARERQQDSGVAAASVELDAQEPDDAIAPKPPPAGSPQVIDSRGPRVLRWLQGRQEVLVPVLALMLAVGASPVTTGLVVPGLIAAFGGAFALRSRGASAIVQGAAYFILAFSVQGLLEAFARPDPAPHADLRLADNSDRTGDWIGVSDGVVYIGQDGKVVGFPARQVMWTRVTHRDRPPEKSLPELLGF